MTSSPGADVAALCDRLETLLVGDGRKAILDGVARKGSIDDSMRRLRAALTSHGFQGAPSDLPRLIRRLDQRTRGDGFRVLHAWNHRTHAFTDDIVPVLLLDFFQRAGVENPDESVALSILLDAYFLHLLTLVAMRAWDTDDPGATLDRVTGLLEALQGPDGSGHRFVAGAETLLIYALSQFHPDEHAYDRVIEKMEGLPETHRVAFARMSAAVLGAHLRWGFWLMYGRDVVRMREDNVGDYPWLLWSVRTLLRAWSEDASDETLDALLLGLAADPWAFTGRPPEAMAGYAAWYGEVRELLERDGQRLLEALESHRPARDAYAPLSLHFNFPHNTLVALVTLALLEGRPQAVPLDDLLRRDASEDEDREGLARALMAFSGGSPDRLGHRGAMLVAYDPLSAMRSFSMTVNTLRKSIP